MKTQTLVIRLPRTYYIDYWMGEALKYHAMGEDDGVWYCLLMWAAVRQGLRHARGTR